MAPTVRSVLSLPEVRRGRPELIAGEEHVDRVVRWVHVSELPDIAPLLRGGELILTTGIALTGGERELTRYVDDLAGAGASGLVIELGRRFAELPDALVRAARRNRLPTIALHREVQFVRITEAVHSVIVDAQVRQLRDSETVHRRFTELTLDGADPDRILANIAELTGRPVVLENLAHQVLGWSGSGAQLDEMLADWESRSRFVRLTEPTQLVRMPDSWLATWIGARGTHWGRLFLRVDGPVSARDTMVLERGAGALAVNRLMERDQASLERMSHRALIDDIRQGSAASDEDAAVRAAAIGVPLAQRRLIGAMVRVRPPSGADGAERLRDAAETIAGATRRAGVPALVGAVSVDEIAMVLTVPPGPRPVAEPLERVMLQLRDELARALPDVEISLAVGSTVEHVSGLRRSLAEAAQVARAAPGLPAGRPYYELSDIHIRGLLHLLGEDPRLQSFVEHELGTLLMYDAAHDTALVPTLTAYLACGRNKSSAADRVRVSRPAFYQRLERIQRILQTDLDDVEACLSLHVAILALDVIRGGAAPPRLT